MKKLLFNLIDFLDNRINSPPPRYLKKIKLFLMSHEKVYYGEKYLGNYLIKLKKFKIMRKFLVLFVILNSVFYSTFAQSPTMIVNDSSVNPDPYVKNICVGESLLLVIGLENLSEEIDSVRVFEYVSMDNCDTYTDPTRLSGDITSLNWLVPSGQAQQGYCYKYLVQVYYGGSGKKVSGLCRINTIDPPTALLSASSNTICAGEEVTFLASGGAIYEFKVNGVREQIGETNLFSSSLLNNNDTVVVVVSENGCSTTSEPISMTVHEIPDLGSVTPSPTCYGDDMEFTYSGLTGSGFWTLSFWNTEHNVQYGDDYSVTSSGGLLTVPIEYGTNEVHLKIIDTATGCSNF